MCIKQLCATCFLLLLTGLSAYTGAQQLPVPDTSYTVNNTYKKLIRDYPFIKKVEVVESEKVNRFNDELYFTWNDTPFGDRKLHADVFVPKGGRKKFPAVLIVHGGGWRSGNKSMNVPMAIRLAESGYVVVSIEYRLSNEAKYPAAVYDAKAAIRWMRQNAKRFKIDKSRIAVAGYSAGGQLAALIGATNGNTKFEGVIDSNSPSSSEVQAVINLDGLLDFTSEENLKVKRTDQSADVVWLGGYFEDTQEKWVEASAITWVNKSSPPFLFINSSQPRFHGGCKETVEKLNEFKICNEVHQFEDAPHSYWLFSPWFEPTVNYMAMFLSKVFNPEEGKR